MKVGRAEFVGSVLNRELYSDGSSVPYKKKNLNSSSYRITHCKSELVSESEMKGRQAIHELVNRQTTSRKQPKIPKKAT